MKKNKNFFAGIFAVVLVLTVGFGLMACSGGYKVTYVLPEGVTGTAPDAVIYQPYDDVMVPAAPNASKAKSEHIGWVDTSGNFYKIGAAFKMGTANVTLTAVFRANTLFQSYCIYTGGMIMSNDRFLGPSPAHTTFRVDKTWVADAEGTGVNAHFEGTWDITSAGLLTLKLLYQDGVTKDENLAVGTTALNGRVFSYILKHPGDRSSNIDQTNYVSQYDIIKAYNTEFGASVPLPAERPKFKITYALPANTGTAPQPVEGYIGDILTLPTVVRNGYTLKWRMGAQAITPAIASCFETVRITVLQPGDTFKFISNDLTVTGIWTAVT